nr:YadA-like family protein [Burkholderia guangdongensis]
MNKNYRTIWSEIQRAWIVVSELTATRGKRGRGTRLMVATGLLATGAITQASTTTVETANLTSLTNPSYTLVSGSSGGSTNASQGTTVYYNGGTVGTAGLYTYTTILSQCPSGTASGCWVNTSQGAINNGLNFSANNTGTTVHKNLGDTLPIIGAATAAGAPATPTGTTLSLDSSAPTAGTYSSKNIQTYADAANGQIQIQMADNPVFASVTTGLNGVTVTGGAHGSVVLNGSGLNNGGNTITNVAAGAVTATSTDAVNGSQLYAVTAAAGGGWKLSTNGGTPSTVASGATVDLSPGASGNIKVSQSGTNVAIDTNPNLTATTLTTTDVAGNTTVTSGSGVTTTDASGNQTSVGANGVTITPTGGGNAVSLTSSGLNNGGNKLTNVADGTVSATSTDAVNGSQLSQQTTTLTNQGLNFSDAAGNSVHENLGGTLAIIGSTTSLPVSLDSSAPTAGAYSSKNIQTYADAATGQVQIQMADNPAFASVTTGLNGVTVTGGAHGSVVLSGSGLNNGGNTLTNVAAGAVTATSTDAINGSQLYAVTAAAGTGWNLSTNGGTATKVVPGATVDLSPGTSGNIKVSQSGTNVTIDTNPNLTATTLTTTDAAGNTTVTSGSGMTTTDASGNQTSVGANGVTITPSGGGNTVSLTSTGLNNGGNKLTNVADGTVSATSTDAVNGSQLSQQTTTLTNQGLNFADAAGNTVHENLGGTLAIIGSTTSLPISLDSSAPTAGTYSSKNIQTFADTATGQVQIEMADNPAFASVTTGNTVMNNAGITISGGTFGPVSLTSSGLNNGGNKLTNIADGTVSATSTDAVNGSQLSQQTTTLTNQGLNFSDAAGNMVHENLGGTLAIIGSTTSLPVSLDSSAPTAGTYSSKNIQTYADTATGQVQIQMADNPVFASVTTGNTVMNNAGITISGGAFGPVSLTSSGLNNGGNTITNVAAGAVSATSTDAINGSQLYAVSTSANAGWNLSTNGGTATKVAPGATVDLSPGASGNITVSQTGTQITIDTNPNLTATTLTTADAAGNTTVTSGSGMTTTDASGNKTSVGANGVTITPSGGGNAVSLTSTGLDNGGNKLTNVADGTVSATSTDAVNGSQLYSTNQAVQNLQNAQTHYYSVNDGGTQGSNYANDGATGVNSLAAGVNAAAAGAGSVAIGSGASASVNNGIAIGSGASVAALGGLALGAGSVASRVAGTYNDPISGTSFTTTEGAVSVGSQGSTRQITNVAAGTQTTDAVNLGQLESAMSQLNQAVHIASAPSQTWITGNPTNYAAPTASGSGSTAAGSGSVASGTNSTAVGDGATASGANSVALGANSVATEQNTVSVGAVGSERTISNVAAGVNGTDAVNVNQLNAGLAQANQYTNSQISSLRRDMYGGVASAMAVAGLPQPTAPGRSMVSVATSNWQGQQGVALGVSTISENGRWVYKGSMTTSSRGGAGGVVAAGYQW